MSRWDALRPERRECVAKKSFPQRPALSANQKFDRRSSANASPLDWHRQFTRLNEALKEENSQDVYHVIDKLEAILESGSGIPPKSAGDAFMSLTAACDSPNFAIKPRLKLACRLLKQQKIILTNLQVKECIDNLTLFSVPAQVECLSRLVLVTFRQLPAEETANKVVGNMLLPVLEEDSSDNVVIVLDALQCLVNDSMHASALLAPLTLDITKEGQEDTVTNPLKSRLMRALQSLIRNKSYSCSACLCLISIIKATNPAGDASEFDLSLLEPFFVDAAREHQRGQSEAFELLRLVLKVCPATSSGLSSLLIGDQRVPVQTGEASCSHCKYQNTSPLVDALHDGNDDRIAHVIPCIQELLQSMPLNIWLGTSRPSAGLQHFGKRTKEALTRLIRVVQCRVQQCLSSIPIMCPLIQVVMTRIPYSEDEHDDLTGGTVQLLCLMAQVLMRRQCAELVECFVVCMGGHPQPQGGISTMPVPIRLWINSDLSLDFQEYLWSSVESRSASREDAMRILCAIARSLPSFILADPATCERCQSVIESHSKDVSYRIRLDGVTFLEKLLTGRMEMHGFEGDDDIAIFSSRIAFATLKDTKPQVRTTSLNCYGSLLTRDWLILSKLSEDDGLPCFQQHFNAVLSHCVRPSDHTTEGESNAGARAAACKAVGSMCTQFLSNLTRGQRECSICDDKRKTFCRATCDILLKSLEDPNAGVRSMVSQA